MTDNEIRIAVAEAIGWTDIHEETIEYANVESRSIDLWTVLAGITYEGKRRAIRNYPTDLNACAEFEETLSPDDQVKYVEALEQIIRDAENLLCSDPIGTKWPFNHFGRFAFATASARQRCTAFLRTKGLWKEVQ
jgi:hypothetical protein